MAKQGGIIYLNEDTRQHTQDPNWKVIDSTKTLVGGADSILELDGSLDLTSTALIGAGNIDAADFGSGAALDGQVLTADGAGGAAWEAVPGASESLDDAYAFGRTINVRVAEGGAMQVLGTADEANTLLELTGGVHTGPIAENVLSVTTDDQATGYAVQINNIGSGNALSVQDNGTPNMVVSGAGAVSLTPTSGQTLVLTAAGAGVVDVNAGAGGVTVDATGGSISLDGSNAVSNFSVTTNGDSQDLTISVLGATDSSLILSSTGTGADAIKVGASAGGIELDSALDTDIEVASGRTLKLGTDAVAQTIQIGMGGAAKGITIGNNTGITSIALETGSGGLNVDADGNSVWAIAGTLDKDTTGVSSWNNTSGSLTISTLVSGDLILDAAAQVSVGEGTATSVDIGKTGILTTVKGDLTVDEEAEFNSTVGIDGDLRIGVGGVSKVTVDSATGDTYIAGNLAVDGEATHIIWGEVNIGDSTIYLNSGDTVVAAGTGGLAVNYNPTAITDAVAVGGLTAGVNAVSNPTVATTGAATYGALVGAFIQITGAANAANNGLFEVLSHAANLLTIRGVGLTAPQEDFTQNQFTTDATAQGTITQVNVSVARAGTNGLWEYAKGNISPAGNPLVFVKFALAGDVSLQEAYDNGQSIVADEALGPVAITVDESGAFAGFTVEGATGAYIDCNPDAKTVGLGDADVDVYAYGDFYATLTLDVDGIATLDETQIDTTDGNFAVSGTGDFTFTGVNVTWDPTGNFTANFDNGFGALFRLNATAGSFVVDQGDEEPVFINCTAGAAPTLALGELVMTVTISGETVAVAVADDTADAYTLKEGANSIMAVSTEDGTEKIDFGYNVNATLGLDVTGADFTVSGWDARLLLDNDKLIFSDGLEITYTGAATTLTMLEAAKHFKIVLGGAAGAESFQIDDNGGITQFDVNSNGVVIAATSYGFAGSPTGGDTQLKNGQWEMWLKNASAVPNVIGEPVWFDGSGDYFAIRVPDLSTPEKVAVAFATDTTAAGAWGWYAIKGLNVTVKFGEAVTAGAIVATGSDGTVWNVDSASFLAGDYLQILGRANKSVGAGTGKASIDCTAVVSLL